MMVKQMGSERPRQFSLGYADLTPEQQVTQAGRARIILPSGETIDGYLGYLGFDQFRFQEKD